MINLSLVGRTVVATLAVLICALGLLVFLSFAKYEQMLVGLSQSRYGFIVTEMKANIENTANLGLPLAVIRNIQQIIERPRQQDSHILAITVFDDRGTVLYATDSARIGQTVPAGWLAADGGGQGPWIRRNDQELVIGAPLVNSFQSVIGGIALSYSRLAVNDQLSAMLWREIALAGLVLAAGGIAAALATRLLLLPIRRRLRFMERWVIVNGGDALAVPDNNGQGDDSIIDADFAALVGALRQVDRDLAATTTSGRS